MKPDSAIKTHKVLGCGTFIKREKKLEKEVH